MHHPCNRKSGRIFLNVRREKKRGKKSIKTLAYLVVFFIHLVLIFLVSSRPISSSFFVLRTPNPVCPSPPSPPAPLIDWIMMDTSLRLSKLHSFSQEFMLEKSEKASLFICMSQVKGDANHHVFSPLYKESKTSEK